MHTGSQHEQATVMHMRGLIAGQRQDYAAAKQLHLEALAMWRSLKQDTDVADSLLELGRVARMCEDYDAAEQYFHEALEIYQQQNAREEMLALFIQLGLLAQDRHQWSEARKWSEEALPLAREIGGLESIAFVQFGLAKVWEAEGRADLALPLAQEAVATFERLQHRELAQVRAEVESITAALQKSPNRQ